MVFCEIEDQQRAEPNPTGQQCMLEECRGLRNLSDSKVQRAEDSRLFIAVIGKNVVWTPCRRAAKTCRAPGIPCMFNGHAKMARSVARIRSCEAFLVVV